MPIQSYNTIKLIWFTYLSSITVVRKESDKHLYREKNLNLKEKRERIVSPCELDAKRDLSVMAWTVRWVLSVRVPKTPKGSTTVSLDFLMQVNARKYPRSFVIYRREIYRLLNAPKNPFDQLIFELPCLMGFRASEVATWRIEYIDFQNGETLVLDSKKKVLLPVPLNTHVANLVMQVAEGRSEGYVLKNRSVAWRDKKPGISGNTVWRIWRKYAFALDLYPRPEDYTPLQGRRFFAAEWFYGQELSVVTLCPIMRHSDPKQTLDYVRHIIFAEDVKRDYDKFQFRVMQDQLKVKTT